ELLPARDVQGHLRLPAPLRLAAGDRLAAPQTPPRHLEVASPPPPSGMVAHRRRDQAGHRAGHPAPGGQVFRRGDALVTRFKFVADHRDAYDAKTLCEIVGAAGSSFYARLPAAPTRAARAGHDAALAKRIHAIHDTATAQGVPRI